MGTDCSLSLGKRIVHLDRWHVFGCVGDGGRHVPGMRDARGLGSRYERWRNRGRDCFESGVMVSRTEALERLEIMHR